MMNFSEIIKTEILEKPHKDKDSKRSFLAGIVRGTGRLFERDGELGLEFKVFNEKVISLVENYLKSLFSFELREINFSQDKLNNRDKYVLTIFGENTEKVLTELGIIKEEDDELNVNFSMFDICLKKEANIKALISGLFLSSGSCSVPKSSQNKNTGYHLEIVFNHNIPAYQVMSVLLNYGVQAKIINRKDSFVLYIKSVEEIKNFLAFLPAPVSMLKLTELSINRELANTSNRQKNCDIGNVNRQLEASEKQLQAIEKIEKTVGINSLKPDLREVAKIRKEFPEDTVLELANRLKITKSCINHRLRKIIEISKDKKD